MLARLAFLVTVALLVLLGVLSASLAAEGTRLDAETLAARARDWVVEQLGTDRASLELAGAPRDLALPAGTVTTTFSVQSSSAAAGQITVFIEAVAVDAAGHRTPRSTTAAFRVNAPQDVVVATRELARRMVVSAADVRVERRTADRVPAGPVFRDLGEVVGKEIVRPVAPGEVVTLQAVVAPRVIRRGAIVTLLLEGQGFRLMAKGIAQEDGAVGENIRVVNQSSRKELMGRVEDDRTVRIPF